MALFDDWVYPGRSEEPLDLTEAPALLLRLELAGVDVGDRWERLAPQCSVRVGHHTHVFNDVHCVAALARAGRHDELGAMLAGMSRWAAERDDHAAIALHHDAAAELLEARLAAKPANPRS